MPCGSNANTASLIAAAIICQIKVAAAKDKMIANLRKSGIPLSVLSQFMPIQYTKVREGHLENDPEALIKDRIVNTIDEYLYATHQEALF